MANFNRRFYVLVAVLSLPGCTLMQSSVDPEQNKTEEPAKQTTSEAEQVSSEIETSVVEVPVAVEVIPAAVSPSKPSIVAVEPPVQTKEPISAAEPVVKPMTIPSAIRPAPNKKNWFNVDATIKDKTHPFFGLGNKHGFVVNGEQGKSIVLVRGETHTFDVKTGVAHDFYFTRIAKGWGAGTYAEGVEGQFTFEGKVTFTPGVTAPKLLYYGCRNHKNMGGAIYVINKGEKFTIPDQKNVAQKEKPAHKTTSKQVKQKLSYAKLLLMSSKATKRVVASDNNEAKALVKDAKIRLSDAESSLAAKKPVVAMAAVDEALRLVSAAARLVPAENVDEGADSEAAYDKLIIEIQGYKKSYKKHASKVSDKLVAKLDEDKFNSLLVEAKKLAAKGDFQSAVKPVQKAATMITATISMLLDDTTVVYDKKFSSSEEEYEYELARYESYVELVPIALEQRRPGQRKQDLMKNFIGKGERIADEGKSIAAKGDHAKAIQAMQAATDNVRRALMIIGVR
ncbi:hypothetical protein MNBD_GAMMA16-434 [hydrothermal vent metagenome]|uniref:Uncharacterized protein n=1 Tax=hydrothermal vent metagenome TaxID=652676 RepID=A0A3B0ZA17_9ZZZZ